mgnify:CR=1 FL=1
MMGRDCHASGLEVHLSCCVVVGLDVKILFEVVSFTLGTTTNLRPGCVCVWEGGGGMTPSLHRPGGRGAAGLP